MRDAVIAGAGLGFLSACEAARQPELVEVMPARDEWSVPLWLVTHVDLHRTTKVQAFLTVLREAAKGW
jgi:DNA-binding transcriptional LysR family regulator